MMPLRAAVFLDRVEAGVWQRCLRMGCTFVFMKKAASTRKRLYCSYDCAHLDAVKRSNKRNRADKESRKVSG
jgi:hypothetical protein